MKNIHLIPTDKPSRLFYNVGGALLFTNYENYNGVHIYITSDEEIKDGDWIKWGEAIYKANKKYMPPFKKIILTTDQDLIKDGVQAIDDEFLEWFVKNPSCENIPIIMTTVSKESTYKTNIGFESWRKEEPSQDNRMYSEEEVLDILRKSHSIEQTSKMDSWITKWFEQFKKK